VTAASGRPDGSGPAGEGHGSGTVTAARSAASQPAVVVEALVKRYGQRTVLDGVSLTVDAGELVALLGPNGAGKTTTVEIVEGYLRPDRGLVRVLGIDPARGGRPLRARVGLMLQSGGIDMRARPRETLVQYGRFHVDPRDPDELIDLVGLRTVASTPYRRLSGGERQRLGLALALVGRPEVLVLDEPTAGMDPAARGLVRALITELRASGIAMLLTSHDLTDVERLADRICILAGGRIVAAGTPAELAAGARPRLRFRLDRALDPRELAALAAAVGSARVGGSDGARYEIADVEPSPRLIAAVAAWCTEAGRLIVEARTVEASLEETYLAIVGGLE
jgi:ABC-2 type transport system ATP-binding protein